MNSDPIADFLTRLRNASLAGNSDVVVPFSSLKHNLANVLKAEGYVRQVELKELPKTGFRQIRLVLKYGFSGRPVFRTIKRVSKPGLRKYFKADALPRIANGAGLAVVSTSKGLMSDRQARHERLGGEVLCTVF